MTSHEDQGSRAPEELWIRSRDKNLDISELIDTLDNSPDEWDRWFSARGLGRFSTDASRAALMRHLHDTSAPVRGAVARSLGKLHATDAIPGLLTMASAPENEAQQAYHQLGALAEMRERRAIPLFADHLRSPEKRIRRWAVRCVATIGGNDAERAVHGAIATRPLLERWRLRRIARKARSRSMAQPIAHGRAACRQILSSQSHPGFGGDCAVPELIQSGSLGSSVGWREISGCCLLMFNRWCSTSYSDSGISPRASYPYTMNLDQPECGHDG